MKNEIERIFTIKIFDMFNVISKKINAFKWYLIYTLQAWIIIFQISHIVKKIILTGFYISLSESLIYISNKNL